MRRLVWIVPATAALLLLAAGAHFGLIESSGEVAVLETRDADDAPQQTRLWFVEHQGRSWLSAGAPDAAWLLRIHQQPRVRVVLPSGEGAYRAVPVPEAREEILRRMRAKYGLADRWVRFAVGLDAVPVRLEPLAGTGSERVH